MKKLTLYYATNRNHLGDSQWQPTGYGTDYSQSEQGAKEQNLRFGELSLNANQDKINRYLNNQADGDKGDGIALSGYLTGIADKAKISAYQEQGEQNLLGSVVMFAELQQKMSDGCDVLVYMHGFNVDWCDAVGAALALQEMVNQETADRQKDIIVVLFSWPSNGRAIPWVSYYNDRYDAKNIAGAKSFARGLLKLRDYLLTIRGKDRCHQKIHLLCHSMGNFVLQNTLQEILRKHKEKLPLLFDTVFMCSADVDADVFEQEMKELPKITRRISVYHNEEDAALWISDTTKGNSDRLGDEGINSFNCLSHKIHQIDCTEVVEQGLTEHSYYLNGLINKDVRLSLLGFSANSEYRNRQGKKQTNAWLLIKP